MAGAKVKGHITVPDRSLTKYFMFNPAEVTDTKGVDWGTLKVPGASHPVYQSGAGGDRSISFDLFLDGDRGRYKSTPAPVGEVGGLDISREIEFYQSLLYPGRIELDSMEAMAPYMVLFTFGVLYTAVPCLVFKADVRITDFTSDLAPMRAVISLELKETIERTRTSREVYADYDFR